MARPRTLRLYFEYEGPEVRLVSAEAVEMRPPPSDALESTEELAGFWYDLRDGDGRLLYRRVTHNPIRTSAEVLSDDEERPLARAELRGEVRGEFVLIAPNLEQAATVGLVGSGRERGAAAEIARFELPQRRGAA
jgi:hypothetical protein